MFHQNYFCLQSLLLFILSVESQVTPYNSTKCSNEDLCIQLQNTRRCKRFARSRELLDMFIEPRNNKTHSKTEQEKKKEKEGKEFHKVVDIEKNISKNEIIDTDHKSKNQVIDTKSNKILRQKQLIAACAGSKTVFVFEDLVAYQTTRFKKTRIHKNYIEKFICCMSSGQLPTSAFLRSTIIPDPFIMFEIELTFDFYKYPDYWVLSAMELGVTLRDDQYRFQKYDTCPKSHRKSNVSYEEEFEYDTGKGWFNFTCYYSTTAERYRILNFGVAGNFSIKSEAAAAADLSNPLPGNVMNEIPTFVYEKHNYTWPTPVDPWDRTTTMTTTVTTTTQSEEDKEDQEKKKKVNKTASIIGVIVAVILVVAVLKVFAVFALFWWW